MTKALPFVFLLACAMPPLHAQEVAAPVAADRGQDKAPASVRGWILPGDNDQALALRLRSGSPDEAPRVLAAGSGGQPVLDSGYDSMPAGAAALELVAGEKVLAARKVALQPSRHYTLICTRAGSQWKLESYNDGPLPQTAAQRSVRILNFAEGRESMVGVDSGAPVKIPADSLHELKVPAKLTGLSFKVLDPSGGPPAETSLTADMATDSCAYILVAPDRKGRLVPDLLAGAPAATGALPEAEPEQILIETPQDLKRQRIAALSMELEYLSSQLSLVETYASTSERAGVRRADLQQEIARVRAAIKAAEAGVPPVAPQSGSSAAPAQSTRPDSAPPN